MIVTFQFPIIDFRDLLAEKEQHKLPVKLYVDDDYGMIHNFGESHHGVKNGKNTVPSFSRFFSAKNLIRFVDEEFQKAGVEGARKISRRYYCDDIVIGRIEISLIDTPKKALSINNIKKVISKYAGLPIKIDVNKEENNCKLIESIDYIVDAYYYSTVKKSNPDTKLKSLVQTGGHPVCIVQLEQGERINKITDDDDFQTITINGGEFKLHYFKHERLKANTKLDVYVLEPILENSTESIRIFRRAISLIHAEKQKILKLYSFVSKENNGLDNDDLKTKEKILKCISKTQKNLLKNERFGIDVDEISNLIFDAKEIIDDNIDFKKIEKYTKDIATKFSIGQAQLLCNELNYTTIIKRAEEIIEEYSGNPDRQKDIEELKQLQLKAKEESKYWAAKLVRKIESTKIG